MEYIVTNIRFDRESYRRLKLLAVEAHKSLSQLVREAVEQVYAGSRASKKSSDWHKDPFFDVVGLCASRIKDGALRHDRDIYGVKR